MRILHSADLHLGRSLEGRIRSQEQQEVLAEIVYLAEEKQVDLVLLAGDIYDGYNPSAEAERLFYNFVKELAKNSRAVVAIAGNHDQPERLAAAAPIAFEQAIYLLGNPGQLFFKEEPKRDRPWLKDCGANWLNLAWPAEDAAGDRVAKEAVILALPYASEARLNQIIAVDLADEADSRSLYSRKIKEIWQEAAGNFRPETVNLAMGHFFAVGGMESDSERQIAVGGSYGVSYDAFPPFAQYVALGHLHRPQKLSAALVPCYYAGSPLAYGFGEMDQTKSVLLIDVLPGQEAQVETISLKSGYRLTEWQAKSVAEALSWCEIAANQNCWVNLTIDATEPLTESETKALRQAHPRLLRIKAVLPEAERQERPDLSQLSLGDKFKLFVEAKTGAAPKDELVTLFLELLEEEEA